MCVCFRQSGFTREARGTARALGGTSHRNEGRPRRCAPVEVAFRRSGWICHPARGDVCSCGSGAADQMMPTSVCLFLSLNVLSGFVGGARTLDETHLWWQHRERPQKEKERELTTSQLAGGRARRSNPPMQPTHQDARSVVSH